MPTKEELILKLKQIKTLINKNITYYFLSGILILGFGVGYYIYPKVAEMNEKQANILSVQAELPGLEQQANSSAVATQQQVQQQVVDNNLPVSVYTSPYLNVDLENSGFELLDQVVQIFQSTGNKINEISFTNQPAQGEVGILSVNFTLNTTYVNLEKLLTKIYTWQYLAGMKSLDIEQNKDNPGRLSTKIVIDLYVKK